MALDKIVCTGVAIVILAAFHRCAVRQSCTTRTTDIITTTSPLELYICPSLSHHLPLLNRYEILTDIRSYERIEVL